MSLFAVIRGGVVAQLSSDMLEPGWVDVTSVTPTPVLGATATFSGGVWTFGAVANKQAATSNLAAKLGAGIALTSIGNAALNATYALDSTSQTQISVIGFWANQFGAFPGGSATQAYPDISGVPHTFTVTQYINFLKAVGGLVAALNTQAQTEAAGGAPTWPSLSATIP